MLGRQLFLIFFIGMLTTFSTSGGYLLDRSVDPSFLNLPSSLDSVQNISNGRMLDNNTYAVKIGKFSINKLDKRFDETLLNENPRTDIFETNSENAEKFSTIERNVSSLNSSHLRNIILILVDTTKQEGEEFSKKFERTYSFPVHGYFQVDSCNEKSPMKVDPTKFLFSGRKEDECECKETLRSNISELLTWAHEAKEMTTSVLSATNFSIPATPEIEETFEIVKNNESSESSTKGTIRKRQLQQNDSTRFMDSHESNNSDSPIIITPNMKKDSTDDMWDVIDMFTKIRVAFFRAVMDTLSGPSNETIDDELSFQEQLPHLRTGFANVVQDALKNLERVSGDKGYVLVLAVPENELDLLMDLLHHQISLSDTLQIVTELCSKNTKRVSFFAKGPAASVFHHTHAISELSYAIKSIVNQACQERANNKNRQRHSYEIPIRVIRDVIQLENLTHSNKTSEKQLQNDVLNRVHDHLLERIDTSNPSSSSTSNVCDTITMLLGMATSLIALITVNSS